MAWITWIMPLIDPLTLMTYYSPFEFSQISIDQCLNFVFESCPIFHEMSSNFPTVFTYRIKVISLWAWRSSRLKGNNENSILLNQYREQFDIRRWKWTEHLAPFLLLPRMTWVGYCTVFPCGILGVMETLLRGTTIWAVWGNEWKRLLKDLSTALDFLLFHPPVVSSTTFIFFVGILASISNIFPLFIPSSIWPIKYSKSLHW